MNVFKMRNFRLVFIAFDSSSFDASFVNIVVRCSLSMVND